jgi:hypothetical protein
VGLVPVTSVVSTLTLYESIKLMDDINIDYPFCPESFRLNCASYEVKCFECGGCTGEGSLDYLPIVRTEELATKKHPYLLHKKKAKKDAARKVKSDNKANPTFRAKSKQVKDALKVEKGLLKSIKAKATIGSGRINSDGDGFIETTNGKYYIEVKKRFNGKNTLAPTKAEYDKGCNQGASIFIIESEEMGAIVCLSLNAFKSLLDINT